MKQKPHRDHVLRVFLIAVVLAVLSAIPSRARAAVAQYYWKDNNNNGQWDWSNNQWYSSATSGLVGKPQSDGGAQIIFENLGQQATTINGSSNFSGGFFKLNSIFTAALSSGRNYSIGVEAGQLGIELYSKIETQSGGGTLTINCVTQLGADSEINAVGGALTLGDLRMNGKTLNSYGANSLNITGVISGTGTYNIKNQGLTETYSGSSANTFTGTTTVENSSLLILNKAANTAAIAGFLTINSGATARTDNVNQLNDQLVTVNGTLNLNGNSQSTALAGSGTVNLNGTSASGVLTINNTATDTFSGVITDNARTDGSLIKTGVGTQVLSGANTYDGSTTVNGGTLKLDSAGSTTARLANTSNVTVNSGGALLLANSSGTASNNRINDNATMTLNAAGSTTVAFNTGGLSEYSGAYNNLTGTAAAGIGALTLQSTSIIDMGTAPTLGNTIVAFADSHSQTWSGILKIYNWSGVAPGSFGDGVDQLFFGSSNTGLTQAQLNSIQFYSDNGVTFLGTGAFAIDGVNTSDGEVVPVPEPSTWIVGGLALTAIGFSQRRRLRPILSRR